MGKSISGHIMSFCSKLGGPSSWIPISKIKPVLPLQETSEQTNMPSYSCEPLEDLKLLFKRL